MKVSIEDVDKIKEYQRRMEHKYDPVYYKHRALVLHRLGVQNFLFDDIIVKGEENVRKVQDKQIVYASNHVSMADYLVQGYIFWRDSLPIPRFLAGENLDRFIFGNFFRRCGAMFIDRNEKDSLYWAYEDYYIRKILSNKENLWFCPEGTRTDKLTAKLKTGTIGQLVEVVNEGRDMYIVPSFSSYNKRVEEWGLPKIRENKKLRDELLREARRLRKGGKNLRAGIADLRAKIRDKIYFNLDLAAYIVRPFEKEKGNAYVSFGEPFSVHDYTNKFALAEKIQQELKVLESLTKKTREELKEGNSLRKPL